MFGMRKKRKNVDTVELLSICKGNVVPLGEVPDITFSDKLLGDGVAFVFDGGTIYAPCDGKVIMTSKTNHAIGIRAENGAEIMIHCGLETVNLKGKGLRILAKQDEKICRGRALLEIDRDFMSENHINLITPMIVTNGADYRIEIIKDRSAVDLNDIVYKVIRA